LSLLKDQKWDHTKKYLRETSYAKGTWETSEIIFIPGSIGLNKAGHWINIIIDTILDNKRIIFVTDSCGIHNFDYIKSYFCDTPFDHTLQSNTWKFLAGPTQAPYSNDCGVFTAHVFAMYIKFRQIQGSQEFIETIINCISHLDQNKLGVMGRQHICKSIANKQISSTDNSIESMNIQENESF
jgi:hypothetical protein